MDSFKQGFHRKYLAIAENVLPTLKESKFLTEGVITPEEFVVSGDFLVHQCPSWTWGSGDETKSREYLPNNKQFLYTKNVPCYKRIKQVDQYDLNLEKMVEGSGTDEDDGWVDTHHFAREEAIIDDLKKEQMETSSNSSKSHSDSEIEDMDEIVCSGLLDDPNYIDSNIVRKTKSNSQNDNNIVPTRTYDLFITYDNYYRVPRFWMRGYNEDKKLLEEQEIYEDISQDHAKKTVTFEQNPYFGTQMPSIHPCRQADVMKKLIETVAAGGSEFNIHQYMMTNSGSDCEIIDEISDTPFEKSQTDADMKRVTRQSKSNLYPFQTRDRFKKEVLYDSKGRLIKDRMDLCDCYDDKCPGCFWPCERCSSCKCGPTCRIRRTYRYQSESENWIPIRIPIGEFCLETTLSCGQVFRWQQDPTNPIIWYGVINGKFVQVRQFSLEHSVEFQQTEDGPTLEQVEHYFRADLSLSELVLHWVKADSAFIALQMPEYPALSAYAGIRLIRQDPIECIFAFITSANNNKERIIRTEKSLRQLGFGYRAKYICDTARILGQEGFSTEAKIREFSQKPIDEIRTYLMDLPGIGQKVADCICLYAFDQHEVIPVDVHIGRAAAMRISGGYPSQLPSAVRKRAGERPNIQTYEEVSLALSELWRPYAGWAQLIIFALHQAKLIDIRPTQSSPKKKRRKLVGVTVAENV